MTSRVVGKQGYYTEARSIQAMRNNVGPGSHYLWVAGYGATTGCSFGPATLFVVANIHN